jgi:predicted RNA binding protein YcfA (HicA-like mRNA interferase family)
MSPRQLPVVSGKRIVRALEKVGFEVVSTRSSHCKLRYVSPPRIVIVPLHDDGSSR